MRKPDWYEAFLTCIEHDEFYEFEWQKPATIKQDTEDS
jgi:hypothetical protein